MKLNNVTQKQHSHYKVLTNPTMDCEAPGPWNLQYQEGEGEECHRKSSKLRDLSSGAWSKTWVKSFRSFQHHFHNKKTRYGRSRFSLRFFPGFKNIMIPMKDTELELDLIFSWCIIRSEFEWLNSCRFHTYQPFPYSNSAPRLSNKSRWVFNENTPKQGSKKNKLCN